MISLADLLERGEVSACLLSSEWTMYIFVSASDFVSVLNIWGLRTSVGVVGEKGLTHYGLRRGLVKLILVLF